MTKAKFASYIFACLVVLLLTPSFAQAQSAIEGVVKDSSGAVMPNVTIEASSPALIERSKIATTNGQGRYTVLDLRPGTYSVTFRAEGFKTQRRDNIDVPANVTIPLYVEMAIGAVGEIVEVQAGPPAVAVPSTAHTPRQDRESVDRVPNSRPFQPPAGVSAANRLTPPD